MLERLSPSHHVFEITLKRLKALFTRSVKNFVCLICLITQHFGRKKFQRTIKNFLYTSKKQKTFGLRNFLRHVQTRLKYLITRREQNFVCRAYFSFFTQTFEREKFSALNKKIFSVHQRNKKTLGVQHFLR